MSPRLLLLALLGGGTVVVGASFAERSVGPRPLAPTRFTFPPAKLTGNLSCASASCHAAGDEGRAGSEYSTWLSKDPHYQAYDVLLNERSRRITKALNVGHPAHENETCLRCHAPDLTAAEKPLASHGVGCEGCHGPAEKWRTTHYQNWFKRLTPRQKAEQYGLYPTKNLAFRVSQCASCHVGDATREVNHDLIAAGHPRLAFEYTGYQRSPKYVPHWRESQYGPDFEARAWQIGQLACARRAVELLNTRATRENAPWPELTEYSCFACHKGLTNDKWKPVVASTRTPGALPWGTWYFSMVDLAAGDAELSVDVQRLICSMEAPGRQRMKIANEAWQMTERLDRRLAALQRAAEDDSLSHPFDEQHMRAAFQDTARHALTDDGTRFRDADWDGATQHFLAAAAMYSSWGAVAGSRRAPRFRDPLLELSRVLAFPKGYNSPKDADPMKIRNLFQQLRTPISDPTGMR